MNISFVSMRAESFVRRSFFIVASAVAVVVVVVVAAVAAVSRECMYAVCLKRKTERANERV